MTKMQRLEHENEMMKRTLKSIRNLYTLTELAEVRSTLKAVGEEPKC